MQDLLGRQIRYLRLSLTHACGMQCLYCRPHGYATRRDDSELAPDEIESLVRHLVVSHGLRKVRLTGGEPTVRPDLVEIIERLSVIEGLADLCMTTNGMTLSRQAKELHEAGLRRINVSLDSLSPERFAAITGADVLPRVLEGISAAQEAGMSPVKINTVVMRGQNERELPELLEFAAGRGLEIRFIELMPMGPLHEQWGERYVPESEMRRTLASVVEDFVPRETNSDAARRYVARLGDGRHASVGFVTAMSHPFCENCDRIRIGSGAQLYPCLMDAPSNNLMPAIRPVFDPDALDQLLAEGLQGKAREHPARGHAVMIELGG
jgi:cyclic pyranopterin phosphate synthase